MRPVTFLIVEDDIVDQKMLMRTFKKLKINNPIVLVDTAVEALRRLRGEDGHPPIPSPYLILLDLNLPQMGGLEFLNVIRDDPDLSTAIVFVLTTSADEEDRLAAYRKHVAGYIVKSEAADGLIKSIEMLDSYWRVVEFP